MKIIWVAGARPNFMKIAHIWRAMAESNPSCGVDPPFPTLRGEIRGDESDWDSPFDRKGQGGISLMVTLGAVVPAGNHAERLAIGILGGNNKRGAVFSRWGGFRAKRITEILAASLEELR